MQVLRRSALKDCKDISGKCFTVTKTTKVRIQDISFNNNGKRFAAFKTETNILGFLPDRSSSYNDQTELNLTLKFGAKQTPATEGEKEWQGDL